MVGGWVGGGRLQKNYYAISGIKSILNFPLNMHIKLKRIFRQQGHKLFGNLLPPHQQFRGAIVI